MRRMLLCLKKPKKRRAEWQQGESWQQEREQMPLMKWREGARAEAALSPVGSAGAYVTDERRPAGWCVAGLRMPSFDAAF